MLSPTNVFTSTISPKRLSFISYYGMMAVMTALLATAIAVPTTTLPSAQHYINLRTRNSSTTAATASTDHNATVSSSTVNATLTSPLSATATSTPSSAASAVESQGADDTSDYRADATGDAAGRQVEFPARDDAVYLVVAVAGGAKTWHRHLARTLVDIGPPFNSPQGPPLRPLYVDLPDNGRWVSFYN